MAAARDLTCRMPKPRGRQEGFVITHTFVSGGCIDERAIYGPSPPKALIGATFTSGGVMEAHERELGRVHRLVICRFREAVLALRMHRRLSDT